VKWLNRYSVGSKSQNDLFFDQSFVTAPLRCKHSVLDSVSERVEEFETALDKHISQELPSADAQSSDEIISADQHESAFVLQTFLDGIKRIPHIVQVSVDNCF
jgi:hypothetical protein